MAAMPHTGVSRACAAVHRPADVLKTRVLQRHGQCAGGSAPSRYGIEAPEAGMLFAIWRSCLRPRKDKDHFASYIEEQ